MNLRQRLLIAFLIIILFPCCTIGMIGTIILRNQVRLIEETYQIDTSGWQVMVEPIQVLNRLTRSNFNELCTVVERYPEKMESKEYLDYVNGTLAERFSFLIVLRGTETVYVGDSAQYNRLLGRLPQTSSKASYDGGIYVGGNYPYLIKQQSFIYTDGQEGCFYIATDVNTLVQRLRSAATQAVFMAVAAIVCTAAILVVWIYGGIVRPLKELRKATRQLREGNLDYELHDNSGDEIGQLCRDFEEMRLHLKEQIEVRMKYEEDLKELISNISHDLKTPLTTIKGYSEGLLDGVADTPERQEKYLKTIYSKANDMTLLVDELSYYAKIDTDNLPYQFERVRLNDYFRDCLSENESELELKNFTMEICTSVRDEVEVMMDLEQMKRVINNILGNAVKYRGEAEKGSIKLRLFDQGNFIRVEIEDNGAGISEKDLPYIFERFYRADASRNSKQGGTGLGLAIVKKIIEDHGGAIWADSSLGEGTKISFTLKKCKQKNQADSAGKEEIDDANIDY